MINQSLVCQQYLNMVYHQAQIPIASGRVAETYGEILYSGIDKLLKTISLSEQDSFMDLGSGLGKVVLQIFLRSHAKKVIGIELNPVLHHQALAAIEKVRNELPEFFSHERTIELLLGNFLETPIKDANVLLLGSPCFGLDLLGNVGKVIETTPSIHTVLSLRPILNLKRLPFVKTIRVECSWDTALCYLYSRNSFRWDNTGKSWRS